MVKDRWVSQANKTILSQSQFHLLFIILNSIGIKNNSSKTAYNIKLEKITNTQTNYLEKIDEIVSLKDGELIELDYKLRYVSSKNVEQARQFLNSFPGYLDQIEIIVSYTNESRKIFYTKFIATKNSKTNEHLLRRPK